MDENTVTTEETFDQFICNERDAFVKAINEQEWNTQMRTAAESLLIAYDQMRARLNRVKSEDEIRTRLKEATEDSNNMLKWCKSAKSLEERIEASVAYDLEKNSVSLLKWVLGDK